ncbi:hypothetical protein TNCV_3645391 [Trichonephila clavipes]|nr:hypothetical protein TNCV_3645391 [Trichonephila clavipes]
MSTFKITTTINIHPEGSYILLSVPAVTKSSTSTQTQLLPSTSSVTVTSSESQPPIPLIEMLLPPHLIVYIPLLHLPHPQYQRFHLYQHVRFFKLLPLNPIPCLLHRRMQN